MDGNGEFDENDKHFMTNLSASMTSYIPEVFPEKIEISGEIHTRKHLAVSEMEILQIERVLRVVDTGLGLFYARHKGPEWKSEKLDEMAEPGLVYIWYECGNDISCFLSMMMVSEPAGKTLYLYEIHVLPQFQSRHLGSSLMSHFHKYARFISGLGQKARNGVEQHFSCVATGLTVFSDNEKAFQWYTKLGYEFALDSPRDKRLRNGKTVKPLFYILSRPRQ